MINFLCTSPLPKVEATDAVYNEIEFLRTQFGGEVNSLYPFSRPSSKFPIFLFGVHNFRKIKKLENENSVNHIFGSGLFHLPVLRQFKKPIIYSVVGGISESARLPSLSYLQQIHTITVSAERDLLFLEKRGVKNAQLIRPCIMNKKLEKGIKTSSNDVFRILMASAPWEREQFKSKGIYLLLELLQKRNDLFITFLWRGIEPEFMKELIVRYGVQEKAAFVDQFVNISNYMNDHDCTILLANHSSIIKSYPHSLMESLICGKPVITTQQIPMSDFIRKKGVGQVLESFDFNALNNSVEHLKNQYAESQNAACSLKEGYFSQASFAETFELVYSNCVNRAMNKRTAVF